MALAWTLLDPAATSTTLGVRTFGQIEDNLGALDVTLTHDLRARPDEASAVDLGFPHQFLRSGMPRGLIFGPTAIVPRA